MHLVRFHAHTLNPAQIELIASAMLFNFQRLSAFKALLQTNKQTKKQPVRLRLRILSRKGLIDLLFQTKFR